VLYDELLSRVRVARPCPARWDAMRGDERSRLCGMCGKSVYDLSAMTAREAVELIRRREGRMCVAFFRRADGTVLTSDCPLSWRALRRRWAAISALLAGLVGLGLYLFAPDQRQPPEVDWIRLYGANEVLEEALIIGKVGEPEYPRLERMDMDPLPFPEPRRE
jgi:hypothetical protein